MDCFKRLKLEIPADHRIFREYTKFNYDHVDVKNKVYDKSRTFKQFRLPKNYFSGLPIGEVINDLNLIPAVFLIEAYHCYNWHRDAWRHIAFNLTLNQDSDYIVMFAPDLPSDQHYTTIMYERVEEITYEPRKFVLFNTQVPHISINRGPANRYLLTIAHYSGEPTNSLKKELCDYTDYEHAVRYLEERGLIENL